MFRRWFALAAAVPLLAGMNPAHAEAIALEAGFEVRTIASGLNQPTAIAVADTGQLFLAEKAGRIYAIEAGSPRLVAEIAVHDYLECGLLGLALDPGFSQNGFIYAFATIDDEEQHIIRLQVVDGIGTDPTVIRAHIPTAGTYHNGGCLRFGPDGKLYFSVGDMTGPENAQDLSTLAGKIARINPDGSTPTDNPFQTALGSPRAVFALGMRNPFRFCFALDGRMFATDVGSDNEERREEINLLRAGDNAGWPVIEGGGTGAADGGMKAPIYDYHDKGSAATGIVYYTGTAYPAEYRGNVFQLEYALNRVYRVQLEGDRVVSHTEFIRTDGGPVDILQAPNARLVLCELVSGTIREIVHESEPDMVPTQPDDMSDGMGVCGGGFALAAGLAGQVLLALRLRLRLPWPGPP